MDSVSINKMKHETKSDIIGLARAYCGIPAFIGVFYHVELLLIISGSIAGILFLVQMEIEQ